MTDISSNGASRYQTDKVRVAIMGAGNLGLALADYPGFRQEGFEIAAMFDASPAPGAPAQRGVALLGMDRPIWRS